MASKINGDTSGAWARAPPPALPFGQRLCQFLYNPEEKSVLGRTPKRWAIILTFYMCFYAVLAAMTAICFLGLFRYIDPKIPHYTLGESLIGNNPGVTFRPRDDNGLIIKYSLDNASDPTVSKIVGQVKEFLKEYENETSYKIQTKCTAADNYGYPAKPCFYLKLNKIYDWKPQYYDSSDQLPEDAPADLISHIDGMAPNMRNQIWMSCAEEKTNGSTIDYVWGRGLQGTYYPFMNTKGYISPLLAIQVTPKMNQLITIRCRMWAKNIRFNRSIKEASGYARIQFMIVDPYTTA